MDLSEVARQASMAEGYLSEPEGRLLYRLAKDCSGKGSIVEIGCWKGRSTIWLANGSRAGNQGKVIAIDPHTSLPQMPQGNSFAEFKGNLKAAKVSGFVKPVVQTSEKAASLFKTPVELVFIDGNHEYEFVKRDFELWFPKLLEHGVMAFHDTNLALGPKMVVKELVFHSNKFRNVGFVDSITFAEKVKQNSFWDRLRNRRVLLLKNFFTAVCNFHVRFGIPRPLKQAGKRFIRAMQ